MTFREGLKPRLAKGELTAERKCVVVGTAQKRRKPAAVGRFMAYRPGGRVAADLRPEAVLCEGEHVCPMHHLVTRRVRSSFDEMGLGDHPGEVAALLVGQRPMREIGEALRGVARAHQRDRRPFRATSLIAARVAEMADCTLEAGRGKSARLRRC